MHRPRFHFPLHFDTENILQISAGKWNANARRLLPAAMPERWPQVCRIKISFWLLLNNWFVATTEQLVRFGFVIWMLLNMHVRFNWNKTLSYLNAKRFYYWTTGSFLLCNLDAAKYACAFQLKQTLSYLNAKRSHSHFACPKFSWLICFRTPLGATKIWRLPEKFVFRTHEKLEFGIAQRISFHKYPKSAPT